MPLTKPFKNAMKMRNKDKVYPLISSSSSLHPSGLKKSPANVLATRCRYVSYGTLQRNSVPCFGRGASYYNCRPDAQTNLVAPPSLSAEKFFHYYYFFYWKK
ncbi:Uncharacterized protein Adt_35805 [Abeliophyllum distichum]|uniref:Uncharacterized protein n=1 Tax=Abeliophyllum distichum TaxID=126358 RepID=A0ABD1QFS3_9LAMI